VLRTDASYTAIITAISGCAEPCSHPTMNSAEIQARSADPFHRVDGSMMGPCAKLLRPGRPRHPGADRLQPLTCEHDCHQEGLTVLQTGRMTGGALWSSRRAYSAHPCSQAPRWGPSDPFPRRSPAEDCPLRRCPVSSHQSTEGHPVPWPRERPSRPAGDPSGQPSGDRLDQEGRRYRQQHG
jgi:hypothetical protein